jgi:hypothetical protein
VHEYTLRAAGVVDSTLERARKPRTWPGYMELIVQADLFEMETKRDELRKGLDALLGSIEDAIEMITSGARASLGAITSTITGGSIKGCHPADTLTWLQRALTTTRRLVAWGPEPWWFDAFIRIGTQLFADAEGESLAKYGVLPSLIKATQKYEEEQSKKFCFRQIDDDAIKVAIQGAEVALRLKKRLEPLAIEAKETAKRAAEDPDSEEATWIIQEATRIIRAAEAAAPDDKPGQNHELRKAKRSPEGAWSSMKGKRKDSFDEAVREESLRTGKKTAENANADQAILIANSINHNDYVKDTPDFANMVQHWRPLKR